MASAPPARDIACVAAARTGVCRVTVAREFINLTPSSAEGDGDGFVCERTLVCGVSVITRIGNWEFPPGLVIRGAGCRGVVTNQRPAPASTSMLRYGKFPGFPIDVDALSSLMGPSLKGLVFAVGPRASRTIVAEIPCPSTKSPDPTRSSSLSIRCTLARGLGVLGSAA